MTSRIFGGAGTGSDPHGVRVAQLVLAEGLERLFVGVAVVVGVVAKVRAREPADEPVEREVLVGMEVDHQNPHQNCYMVKMFSWKLALEVYTSKQLP